MANREPGGFGRASLDDAPVETESEIAARARLDARMGKREAFDARFIILLLIAVITVFVFVLLASGDEVDLLGTSTPAEPKPWGVAAPKG